MSEIRKGQLDSLQQAVVDRLKTEPLLEGVDIFYEDTKDIENEIARALGTLNAGICIIVTPPAARSTKPNLPGPYFDNIAMDINVLENVIINQGESGTKKTAAYIAELVAHRLHHFQTTHGRTLIASDIQIVADPEYRMRRVPIKTAFGLS